MVRLNVYQRASYYALKNLNLEYVIPQRNITRKGLVDLNLSLESVGQIFGRLCFVFATSLLLVCQLDFVHFISYHTCVSKKKKKY